MDVVQHFASIDHAILSSILGTVIRDPGLLDLVQVILAGGDGVLQQEYSMIWFPGDDLLAACRPRGLPIGNLTSQFWSNCYLHPFDQFVPFHQAFHPSGIKFQRGETPHPNRRRMH